MAILDGRVRLMLWALAALYQTGYAVAQEIRAFLEDERSYAPGHRGVKRAVMVDLVEEGLAVKETPLFIGPSKLALVRLTDAGYLEGERLLGSAAVESEWERINRLHRGEEWERHTVGLLAFAWQARRRGWDVELMPGHNLTGVVPDARLSGDCMLTTYAEFEVRPRGRVARWKRWGELARDGIVVCTFTESGARGIAREFDAARVKGNILSLEELIRSDPDGLKWNPIRVGV
jgi:hypothetical protein